MKMRAPVSMVRIDDKTHVVCVGIFEICRISADSNGKHSAELSDMFFVEKTQHDIFRKLLEKFHADEDGMVTVYSSVYFGKYTVFSVAGEELYSITALKAGKHNTLTVGNSNEYDVWRMMGAKREGGGGNES